MEPLEPPLDPLLTTYRPPGNIKNHTPCEVLQYTVNNTVNNLCAKTIDDESDNKNVFTHITGIMIFNTEFTSIYTAWCNCCPIIIFNFSTSKNKTRLIISTL